MTEVLLMNNIDVVNDSLKINNSKVNIKKILAIIFGKVLPYALIAILIFRMLCYQTNINSYIKLSSSPLPGFMTVITLLAIWFEYVAVLITILRAFFNFKLIVNLARFVCLPVYLLNIVVINNIMILLVGSSHANMMLFISYLCESIFGIIISIYYLINDFKTKTNYKDILLMLLLFLLMLIPAMPSYVPQFIFGRGKTMIVINDLSFEHRLFLYFGILAPVILYFVLRNKEERVIRFFLIYISLATLIVFMYSFNYTNFKQPWTWPFHLCNTAMFIIPLCLIFKLKRLFYFTYFINVFGALIAMLMPNYADTTNVISFRIFNFWYNHWIAFFMPLLIVALKQFPRPKIKQFYWSTLGFFGYFMLVLTLNVYFNASGHEGIDYFFINSDYVADKLGDWAERIYNLNATITVGDKVLVFHPLYQVLFFIVYVLLGLAIWFVYAEFFRIADSHYLLHQKLKKIRQDRLAKESVAPRERKEKFMAEQAAAKASLKLINFSKKYATSKIYAVEDASFEVEEGEIFGFLGPNGAGKSTIIKSIVGIQPITSGSIEICGFDVTKQPVEAKYNIGYVPDHYALYEKLTGREYINYIADIYEVSQEDRDERINKYVKLFELEASIDSKIKTYSHGMKQKITIMSALVHNPKVWILDEPLTGLDPTSIYQVKECMRQHAADGNIVFFSSHLIDIVEKLCQKIAIIKHGKIQCIKNVEEIEASNMTLEEFYLSVIGNNEDPRIDTDK